MLEKSTTIPKILHTDLTYDPIIARKYIFKVNENISIKKLHT